MNKSISGFTIVELIVVITAIGILAGITTLAYNSVRRSGLDSQVQSDIQAVAQIIDKYYMKNNTYPSTGGLSRVLYDSNCNKTADNDGGKTANWVPGVSTVLPQNPGLNDIGVNKLGGCYMYASDGTRYIISAFNAKESPSKDKMYRRPGWREITNSNDNLYYCNHVNIGGLSVYNESRDYYKYSYTVSNIKDCDETPPAGA